MPTLDEQASKAIVELVSILKKEKTQQQAEGTNAPAKMEEAAEAVKEEATEKKKLDKKESEQKTSWWNTQIKFSMKGIKEWFQTAKQQKGFIGFSLRMMSRAWEGLKSIFSAFGKLKDNIIGHVKDVLGSELTQLAEIVGSAFSGIKNAFFGVFSDLFERGNRQRKKTNKWLRKIYNYFISADKKAVIDKALKKKKSLLTPLGMIAALAGLLGIAAAVFFIKFFRPLLLFFKTLGGWATIARKVAMMATKTRGVIGAFIKPLSKLIANLTKVGNWLLKSKIFGMFLRPFAAVIKKWPLIAALFAIYDFFKGFSQADGTFLQRIHEGMKSAIHGFFDAFIDVIGWIGDYFLKMAGIKLETGLSDQLKDLMDIIIDLFSPWIQIQEIIDFFKSWKEKGFTAAAAEYTGKYIGEKAKEASPSGVGVKIGQGIREWWNKRNKAEEAKEKTKKEEDKPVQQTNINQQGGTNVNATGTGVEAPQIPDEVDNYPVTIFNTHYGGA